MAKRLFDMFALKMKEIGVITHEGSLVDASFIDVPKQRNSKDENDSIKKGESDDLWEDKDNKNTSKKIKMPDG